MTDARRRATWTHTSHLLAQLATVHRDPKRKPRPYSARDFNPTVQANLPPKPKANIRILKDVFVDRK